MKATVTLFILLTIFSLNTSAQDIPSTILEGHTDSVGSVAFSPNGQILASGSSDRTIRLWDVTTRKTIRTLKGHTDSVRSVAFSPDGSTIASGSGIWIWMGTGGDNTIRLWDTETGNHIRTLTKHTKAVKSVAFSVDGSTIASGSLDSTIRLWDAETGNHIHTLTEHEDYVHSVVFSPDGQTLASGSGSSTIRLWDVGAGAVKRTLNTNSDYSILSLSFSPDGRMLASGSGWTDYSGQVRRFGRIRLWDVGTGTLKYTLTGHEGYVNSVAFSPDGKTLASGSDDGTIKLWDVSTGLIKNTLMGHRNWVASVAFSPNGTTLASGSGDNTIRLWKLFTAVNITPSQVESPAIGEQFFVNVSIVGGENVGGYQLTLEFDSTALHYVGSANGDYLPEGTFFVPPVVSKDTVTLGATVLGNVSSGDGTLATLTFEVVDVKKSNLVLSNVILTDSDGEHLANYAIGGKIVEPEALPSSAIVSIIPSSVRSPTIGGQLTFNVDIIGAQNITDYHFTWEFDSTALEYISSREVYNLVDRIDSGSGNIGTRTFKVLDVKPSTVSVSGHFIGTDGLHYIPTFKSAEVVVPTSSAVVSITPSSVLSPAIGEQITFNLDIAGGQNITGYHLNWDYDRTAFEFVSSAVIIPKVDAENRAPGGTRIYRVLNVKTSTVSVSGYLIDVDGIAYIPTFVSAEILEPFFGDVNRDGVVNILDLVQVASKFGRSVRGDPADVNEDGFVNIVDFVKVAGALGDGAAAPSAWNLSPEVIPTRADVQQWLSQAQQLNLTDATSQRGILFLENLLVALTPKETALLPNYPNPFNPETWIPYQLAEPADVTLTIYAVDGTVVRTLALGHQPVGIYQDKSHAAYWDGKNALGEPVASGVYFYTLKAGDFSATRKMLIRK